MASDIDGFDLVDPHSYARAGAPHETWTRLRSESPVHWCEPPDYKPFWAVTKHADICEISKQPDKFLNRPGIVLVPAEREALLESGGAAGNLRDQMRTIIETDPPEHRRLRRVGAPWFTPNAVKRLDEVVAQSARSLVDHLAETQTCDFVTDISSQHPLTILCQILGVPKQDEPTILRLTNELFGGEDPEFRREGSDEERLAALGLELYQYFAPIIQQRRKHPSDDFASHVANFEVEGERLGEVETFGYYLITFSAGHETTRNALTGGMLALIENPEQLAKLKADPGLATKTFEEIVRWTTPVNYMVRTAACDYELRDRKIHEGERLLLFYASANRDEEIFDEPFRFDIERHPNRHLGFGIGEHFCLGANLARKSARAFFSELVSRLDEIALAGPPEYTASSFVAGIKHLPIRCRVAARA